MHKLLTAAFYLLAVPIFGASPSFQSFNQNQFNTNGLNIALRSGALLTNPVINSGTITGNGSGLTNVGGVVNSNAATVSVLAGRDQPGTVFTSYTPFLGGSAASMSALPLGQDTIQANQLKPLVMLSSRGNPGASNNLELCTENNMRVTILTFNTNGHLAFTTNRGVRVVMGLENGWLTNHRAADGTLQWNTNRFPSATLNPSNVANIALTNNMELGLMMYRDAIVPTNNNTECDINPVSGVGGLWHYPNGVNGLGAVEIQPITTGDKHNFDLVTYYNWNVWNATYQDTEPYYYTVGDQKFSERMSSYFSVYPDSRQTYQATYPNAPHAILLNALYSAVGFLWPFDAGISLNGICFGSNGQSVEPAGSFVLGDTISNIRPQLQWLTNMTVGKTHLIMQGDNLTDMQLWGYVDWKNHLSLVGMFNANLWLTYPHQTYFSNATFSLNYTNAGFFNVWQDNAQNRVKVISFGVTNGVVVKQLVNPNQYAVLMFNMGSTAATNLTVPFYALGWETNVVATITDVWTNSFRGITTNSLTLATGPTNTQWVILERKDSFNSINLSVVTNNTPGLVGADGQVYTLGQDTNQLIISKSGISIGANHSGLALTELHTMVGNVKSNALNIDDQFLIRRNKGTGLLEFDGLQTGATGFIFATNNSSLFTISGLTGVSVRPRATFTNGVNDVSAGSSIPTNTASFNIVTNDFVLNAFNTNSGQRAYVSASISLASSAGGSDFAKVNLYLDQNADGTFEQTEIGVQNNDLSVRSFIFQLGAYIQPGARFMFTNLSTVGATGVSMIPGSSQWVRQ